MTPFELAAYALACLAWVVVLSLSYMAVLYLIWSHKRWTLMMGALTPEAIAAAERDRQAAAHMTTSHLTPPPAPAGVKVQFADRGPPNGDNLWSERSY